MRLLSGVLRWAGLLQAMTGLVLLVQGSHVRVNAVSATEYDHYWWSMFWVGGVMVVAAARLRRRMTRGQDETEPV